MRWFKVLLLLVILWFSLLYPNHHTLTTVKADDVNQQLSDKAAEIAQLEAQLSQIRDQEKTLNSQLQYIDTQAKLTQAKIDQTNFQIKKLDSEINDLDNRITRLSGSVDALSAVLLQRIANTYKYSNISTIDLIFSSKGFSDMLERLKYIQVAQEHDKKVLYELQATKASYNDQKSDKQTRQAQEEKLKGDLDNYQKQLDADKAAKTALLRVSQNNEAIYQARLQAALAEQQAILALFGNIANEVPDGPIHQGDTVGTIIPSASACSSGPHLHFEVHQGSSVQNPSNYLANTSFDYVDHDGGASEGAISPNGNWSWPISGSIIITQGYGMTPYAKLTGAYGPSGHTGIDMWGGWSNLSVKSVHDGQLSHGGIPCQGGTLLYKRVDHGDGISSYYLHVY